MKTRFSKNLLCLLLAAVLTVGTLASCAQNLAASAAESGITAVYASHQEIMLEQFKGWA